MATLRDILNLNTTPAANEVQCGWAANHSLRPAKEAAHTLLTHRDHWKQVMA